MLPRRLTALALSLCALPALAQTQAPERAFVPYPLDSGRLEAGEYGVLLAFEVEVGRASWMRLHFAALELGGAPLDPERGRVRITSLRDGAVQHLDALGARQWAAGSAYFNGDAVLVELLAGPSAGPCRMALETVEFGLPPRHTVTICGNTDDRAPSNDPRSARLMPIGCTGWIFDDCHRMLLTAGHCTGNLQVVQFQVPPSSPGGTVNHPPPAHQYAVDASSLQTQGGAGVGFDWAYFGAFPNTETGLTPFQAQNAFFALATPPTAAGTPMRITGYGTASGALNQTQQTSTGPFDSLAGTTLAYAADTTGGNSGSPVILDAGDQAVGIHTHGGCSSSGGSNKGTSILLSALQQALANPRGITATPFLLLEPAPEALVPGRATPLAGRYIASVVPGSAFLRYRDDGGPFQMIPLQSLGGTLAQATLPAAACGSNPEWYIQLTDAVCGPRTLPVGAPAVTFRAAVGELVLDQSDDLEQDLGWSTEILGASAGAWQRGVPVNDPSWAYDPASDADGSGACWLTQNQLGNTDVDDGAVRLTSYAIALPNAPASLEYAYFLRLTVADGADRLLVEVRVEPAGAWTELARHDQDGGLAWRTAVHGPAELAAAGVPQGATIRVRFTANDANPQSIVEAGVDALAVRALECSTAPGTNACIPGANGATITATGSASIAANDFTLRAQGLPPFANGVFFHGGGLQQVPFGNGYLCATGAGGLCRLTPVQGADAVGTLERALDLSIPGACGIQPGTTRVFQAWFRDATSFDLTDAWVVTFTD